MKNPLAVALPILLLSLLAACGEGDKKGAPGAPPGAAMPPAEVDVITASPGSTTLTQDLPGRLLAVRSAQVRARVEGVIEKRLFVEGSDIKAGTPLYRIDARTYQAQAAAAEADLAATRAVFERYKPLLDSKAVSQQEFDAAQAKVKQAEAALAKARLDLENAVPPAPISGRIGRDAGHRRRAGRQGRSDPSGRPSNSSIRFASNSPSPIPTCCACSRR